MEQFTDNSLIFLKLSSDSSREMVKLQLFLEACQKNQHYSMRMEELLIHSFNMGSTPTIFLAWCYNVCPCIKVGLNGILL